MNTVFVTLFPTTVETASCGVRKLLCAGLLPITLICIVLVVAVIVLSSWFSGNCLCNPTVATASFRVLALAFHWLTPDILIAIVLVVVV